MLNCNLCLVISVQAVHLCVELCLDNGLFEHDQWDLMLNQMVKLGMVWLSYFNSTFVSILWLHYCLTFLTKSFIVFSNIEVCICV